MTAPGTQSEEIQQAFVLYERDLTVRNYRVACVLGIIFMPLGAGLDYVVADGAWFSVFFVLRLVCSALLLAVYFALGSPWGQKNYKWLGYVEVSLPLFFISLMIALDKGSTSTYYAGLNLVLMGAGLVLRWTFVDNLVCFGLAMLMYISACYFHDAQRIQLWSEWPARYGVLFFNNIYFLIVTAAFGMMRSIVYTRLRFREFELRFQLDANQKNLATANTRLLELDRVKSRFFANISHELRTPLTLLIAPLESLKNRFTAASEPETADLLVTMQANGMRLLKLINDLLDLVKLESGRMSIRKDLVHLPVVLPGLVKSVRPVADDRRIQLAVAIETGLEDVVCDRDKLEKIALNLLFNAVKFTPAGGTITLGAKRDKNTWIMSVQDTGVGIQPEHLPHIFDRFWQADTSSQRKFQGAGIGLALVKELAEIQGGTVWVESRINHGTTMFAQLPMIPLSEAEQAAAYPQESGERPPEGLNAEWLANLYRRAELFPSLTLLQDKVRQVDYHHVPGQGKRPVALVADDEPDMLRFIKHELSSQLEIMDAVDGRQALEKASQFLPDIILLDMMMPEMDGLEVCRELRRRTPTQRIPIILLTARADEETKFSILAAGANDFLSKPFSTTELRVRIANLVASRDYEKKIARQNLILESTVEQLKDTELQLVQTEKMASLGRLSAGLLHEINNPVNFARTAIFTLRKTTSLLPESEQADFTEVLVDVEEGLNRIRTIVSDLRSFTNPNVESFAQVKVEECVRSTLRFISHETKDVVIRQRLDEALVVSGNQQQIVQILINLMQNAIDAMRTKKYLEGGMELVIDGAKTPAGPVLIIRDNGPGIQAAHFDKIFDPFFTTKDVGKGMGLGLSISFKIMQNHGGRIVASTKVNEFTEFRLEFPAAPGQEA